MYTSINLESRTFNLIVWCFGVNKNRNYSNGKLLLECCDKLLNFQANAHTGEKLKTVKRNAVSIITTERSAFDWIIAGRGGGGGEAAKKGTTQ